MVTTVRMMKDQVREKFAGPFQLKMDHDVLSEAYGAAFQTNARNPKKSRKNRKFAF